MQERVRVVLIDESSFVLKGLQVVLSKSPHILVAGTARTKQEAVALVRTCQPDVVVLDVRVGRASGITLCGVIRESYPNTAVLFFTGDDDRHTLQSAILAGAQGYVLKGASDEAIVKSVEIVAAGQAIMDQRLTSQLLAWVRDGKRTAPRDRVEDCSSADHRILSLIAAGQSNNEIARELSRRTKQQRDCTGTERHAESCDGAPPGSLQAVEDLTEIGSGEVLCAVGKRTVWAYEPFSLTAIASPSVLARANYHTD